MYGSFEDEMEADGPLGWRRRGAAKEEKDLSSAAATSVVRVIYIIRFNLKNTFDLQIWFHSKSNTYHDQCGRVCLNRLYSTSYRDFERDTFPNYITS